VKKRYNPGQAFSSKEPDGIDLCLSGTGCLFCRHHTSQKKTNTPFEAYMGIICGCGSDFVQGRCQVRKAHTIEQEEMRPQDAGAIHADVIGISLFLRGADPIIL
jgi:hypothetical protein